MTLQDMYKKTKAWMFEKPSSTIYDNYVIEITNKVLAELYEENKSLKVTLGLIYGYEQPQNHIQICDGQQRLTTLFLLLGYINIKVGGKFNTYIISEKEMNDAFVTYHSILGEHMNLTDMYTIVAVEPDLYPTDTETTDSEPPY